MIPSLVDHHTTAAPRPALLWRFAHPLLVLSSAPSGGGLGLRSWLVNAEVPMDYDRIDVDAHVAELAAELRCSGDGVGMLTAARVGRWQRACDGGVEVVATVGLSKPTWAASADDGHGTWQPGTINIAAFLPVPCKPAALVNAVVTLTEAKAQALAEHDVPGTGTASDAVCVVCPVGGQPVTFAGPRSTWGARLARACHAAIGAGVRC